MYEQTGDIGYLDRAIVDYERSVEITAPAAPERPSRSYNLGSALLLRHARTGRRADRRASRAAYRAACRLGLHTSPEWALSAARAWGGWASSRRDWRDATEAYGFGLEAMRRLFTVQLVREDKEAWLRSAAGLSSQASFALAQRRSAREAASVLEQGRPLLLSEQLEQHRTDLRQLAIDHPELAARYRTAVGGGGAARPGRDGDATFA